MQPLTHAEVIHAIEVYGLTVNRRGKLYLIGHSNEAAQRPIRRSCDYRDVTGDSLSGAVERWVWLYSRCC